MTTIAERYASFKRLIAQAIIAPVVLLLLLAGLLGWQIQQLLEATRWVDHTDQVIAQAYRTQRVVLQAQSELRGYLIARERRYLDPFNQAQNEVGPQFDDLRILVKDRPSQVHNVLVMESTYASWAVAAKRRIAQKDQGPAYIQGLFIQSRGPTPIDVLLDQFNGFIGVEAGLREKRVAQVQSETKGILASAVFLALASGLILGLLSARRMGQVSSEYEQALSYAQKSTELLSTTLLSIGDGVIVTDHRGRVTQINAVAEQITGWKSQDAIGKDAKEVFQILNETTRETVLSPVDRVIREGVIVGLANHTVLVRPDGTEVPIDDSGAPIRDDEGRLIGVVLVFRDITERKRAEDALAKEFEKQSRIAEALQSSLLIEPDANAFPHLETKTLYRAARQEAEVGGDYYDLFMLEDSKVALVVGDVSGKGLDAAAKTAELKYTLRSYLREHPHATTGIVRLNAFICEALALDDHPSPFFLCLSLIVFDPVSRTAEVCVGGAEPPLILRENGEVEQARVAGMPLGVDPKAEYEPIRIEMGEKDVLVLVTDGLTEARRGKEFLGIEGLTRLVKACSAFNELGSLGNCVLNGAEEFAEGGFSDDVCMLLARAG